MRIGGRERSAVYRFHHELDAGWAAGHHEPHWCWSDIFAPLAGLSGIARSEVPVKRGFKITCSSLTRPAGGPYR